MLDKRAVLASTYRVLKLGGRFLCLTPNAEYVWYRTIAPRLGFATRHLSSDRMLTRGDFYALLAQAGFRRIRSASTFVPRGDVPAAVALLLTVLDAIGRHARLDPFGAASRCAPGRRRSPPGNARRSVAKARAPPGDSGRVAFAVPGDLATPTGGYRYDRRIIQELRRLGWQVDVLDLGDGFPFPSLAQRATALKILSAVPGGCPIVLDGLAFALPEAGSLGARTPLIALVHQPLALESGLDPAQANIFRESERAALAAAACVVVTSAATARIVIADYDVESQRISVVLPGNDPVPPAPGSKDAAVRLLSIGSVVPGKGYDLLIAAVATNADLPWRLTIAGDRTRNPLPPRGSTPTSRPAVSATGSRCSAPWRPSVSSSFFCIRRIRARVAFRGSRMALAEAIAHGLPVVSTTAGAIPDTVPAGAGVLVPPDDVVALARALRRLIGDRTERRRLAINARAAAAQLPTWKTSARLFARAIETVG